MPQPAIDLARPPVRDRRAGSAILVAVVFTTIIMLGLGGLLPMLVNDWKASAQISTQEAAFTLAESGVDEAVWAVLEFADDDDAWTDNGWSDGGNFWHREWTLAGISRDLGEDFELDEGRTGLYRVLVQKVSSSTINIVSQGVVTGGKNVRSGEISRIIETEFRRPNPFGYGLISIYLMDYAGQPFFDSYNSNYQNNPGSSSGPLTNAIVGSLSDLIANLQLSNATIFGDLATGATDDGSDPSGKATVAGDTIWEFTMDLPEVEKPNTSGWSSSF